MFGIGYWLTKHAQLHPNRVALVSPQKTYSYGDLDSEANKVAHALKGLGIKEGDRIAVLAMNYPEFLTIFFGVAKIGAVQVSLNYRLTAPELVYQLQDSGARLLFAGSEQAAIIPALRGGTNLEGVYVLEGDAPAGCKTYSQFISGQADSDFETISWDKPLLIVYTSGTTGKPKGAVLTHANHFWNAMNDIIPLRFTADDCALTLLPLVHVGGLGLFTLPMLLLGGKVILPRKFDPDEAWTLIEKEKPTIVMGVPAVFQFLIGSPKFKTADASSVRAFYNGGDRCPLEVAQAFRARGLPFGGGYGLTETSPTAFMMEPDDYERGTSRLGFIGKAAFFNEVRVMGSDGSTVAQGEIGELQLRGGNVFSGYWNKAEASHEAFTGDGWFRTGDLVSQDETGLTFVSGRSKEMFKSGGLNVYPAEVEVVLAQHAAVKEVCVIGVPDAKWNEVGKAIVAIKSEVKAEELIKFCEGKLAAYKIPKSVVFVDALPRNSLGKVMRGELKGKYG